MTHSEDAPLIIYYRRIAIDDIWQMLPSGYFLSDSLYEVGTGKRVAGVEEPDVIACSSPEAFVHRVIETLIGLTDPIGNARFVLADDVHCTIRRLPVNNQVLNVGV